MNPALIMYQDEWEDKNVIEITKRWVCSTDRSADTYRLIPIGIMLHKNPC